MVGVSLGLNADVLFDLGTQRADDPNGEVLVPIIITIPMVSWHDMTANGIRLMGQNLYFLFCSEACPHGIIMDCAILLSAF